VLLLKRMGGVLGFLFCNIVQCLVYPSALLHPSELTQILYIITGIKTMKSSI
jgi:uncharacterized membrane protein YuzA (DUF378 family)